MLSCLPSTTAVLLPMCVDLSFLSEDVRADYGLSSYCCGAISQCFVGEEFLLVIQDPLVPIDIKILQGISHNSNFDQ